MLEESIMNLVDLKEMSHKAEDETFKHSLLLIEKQLLQSLSGSLDKFLREQSSFFSNAPD
jgi:hypothetical protein